LAELIMARALTTETIAADLTVLCSTYLRCMRARTPSAQTDAKFFISMTPTERLEWLLAQTWLSDAHATV
jgi:hypothetical protein